MSNSHNSLPPPPGLAILTQGPWHCLRCGHEWYSRQPQPQPPRACAGCRSAYWSVMPSTQRARTPGPGWEQRKPRRRAKSIVQPGGLVPAPERTAEALAELGPPQDLAPLPPPPLLRAEIARYGPVLVVTADEPQPESVVGHRALSIDELRAKIATVVDPVELAAEAVLESIADEPSEEESAEARAAAAEAEENSLNEP